MDFQLVIVRGRCASGTIKLGDGVTTVGRHDDCQLRIKSSQVSRKHCAIFEKKGLLLVKDLGSSNGTFVNGKRIEEQRILEPGDELMVGQITLKVAKIGTAPPPPPAPAVPSPGDTAVVAAAAAEAGGDPDDFDIEFDEGFESPEVEDGLTETPVAAHKEPESPRKSAPKKTEPETEPAPAGVDDAVADFLLDIKFDDEE